MQLCENGFNNYYFRDDDDNIRVTALDVFLKYKKKEIDKAELLERSKIHLDKDFKAS